MIELVVRAAAADSRAAAIPLTECSLVRYIVYK